MQAGEGTARGRGGVPKRKRGQQLAEMNGVKWSALPGDSGAVTLTYG